MDRRYINFGCGTWVPDEWYNVDGSPRLKLERLPLLQYGFTAFFGRIFPKSVDYADITRSLPVPDNSCMGIYCSHVLEHLSFEDFKVAITNTHRYLAPYGIFRLVVPDIEQLAKAYLSNDSDDAAIRFIESTYMGVKAGTRGTVQRVRNAFGVSHHLWMWDHKSVRLMLGQAGFKEIRDAQFGDSSDLMFKHVESESRFQYSVAVECRK